MTQTQLERRSAILTWIRSTEAPTTTRDVRAHLEHYHQVFVTEDTVAKDLAAMARAGSLERNFYRGKNRWNAPVLYLEDDPPDYDGPVPIDTSRPPYVAPERVP